MRISTLTGKLLQVLCVILLHNAGLKSKDVSARSMAIDLLGIIATRLKQDAVLCSEDRFWTLLESESEGRVDQVGTKDCALCLGKRAGNLLICQICPRRFHAGCLGLKEVDIPSRNWHCPFCVCKRQLLVLQSYCKTDTKSGKVESEEDPNMITQTEVVQQMLLNYLQDAGSADDAHTFICWFVPDSFHTNFVIYVGFIWKELCAGFICAFRIKMFQNLRKNSNITLLD